MIRSKMKKFNSYCTYTLVRPAFSNWILHGRPIAAALLAPGL